MKTNWSKIVRLSLGGWMVAGILCVGLQRAEATVLAQYTFTTGFTSSDTAVGESASSFLATGFTAAIEAAPFSGSASVFASADQIGAALDTSKYFFFTVTPTAGNRLNLSGTAALTFEYSRNTAMTAFSWAIRSSVDTFGSDIATGSTTSSDTLFGQTVDLSTAFDSQDSAVEFRFFVWDSASDTDPARHGYFDNVVLNGTVVPVPEPVNVALAVFGVCLTGIGLGRRLLRSRA